MRQSGLLEMLNFLQIQATTQCIPVGELPMNPKVYLLKGIPPGNYSGMIKATTMARDTNPAFVPMFHFLIRVSYLLILLSIELMYFTWNRLFIRVCLCGLGNGSYHGAAAFTRSSVRLLHHRCDTLHFIRIATILLSGFVVSSETFVRYRESGVF